MGRILRTGSCNSDFWDGFYSKKGIFKIFTTSPGKLDLLWDIIGIDFFF